MNIYPNTKLTDIYKYGTQFQQIVCNYFDENDNGMLDEQEALKLQFSTINVTPDKLIIKYTNGKTDIFEGINKRHDENYYKSGSIPVAVLDDYTMGDYGALDHGYITCNILKKYNSNLSLDLIETNPSRCYNKIQKLFSKIIQKHPKINEFLCNHSKLKQLIFGKENDDKSLQIALDELNQKIQSGAKYKAINLSLSYGFEYNEINRLVANELGIEITSDNIANYKKQILEILETKKDEKLIQDCKGKNSDIKVSTLLNIVKSIEKTKVPFYIAASYKTSVGEKRENTFNFLALANNAVCVEAGKVDEKGNITHGQNSSHSSLSCKNKKKYIEDSSKFYCGNILGGGTSFATPMALAKDLKID